MTTTFATCYVESDGGVARLVLNRPCRRNAVDSALFDDLQRALDLIDQDDSAVVIVKGNGTSFSIGRDIKEAVPKPDDDGRQPRQWQDHTRASATARDFTRLWQLSKPTIAQVHGFCIGEGCALAMQCDLVYCATDAILGQPQVHTTGMTPEFANWPLTIGLRNTKELLFTGDVVDGAEAAEMGMVNRALDPTELEAYVEWVATRVAAAPRGMAPVTKLAANEAADAMGYRQMLSAAAHASVLQRSLPACRAATDRLRELPQPELALGQLDDDIATLRPRRGLWNEQRGTEGKNANAQ
ncbi:enoyl-CoA hydratase/isomerase family protein [Mycobacterium sp. NPDC003449]